jgi:hypothetical protein
VKATVVTADSIMRREAKWRVASVVEGENSPRIMKYEGSLVISLQVS